MAEKKTPAKKAVSVKQETLEAYGGRLKELQEGAADSNPQSKMEERTTRKAIETAEALSADDLVKNVGALKSEIGRMLSGLGDRLEAEVLKYGTVKKAIEAKEKELEEIYDIQRSAFSLVALVEAQQQKRAEFETEITAAKEELEEEIRTTRLEWEKEQKLREAIIKERDAAEQKRREREKEEFDYGFARQKQLAAEQFEHDKLKLQRDMQVKKEQMEKDLLERERVVIQKEQEFGELRARAAAFPQELHAAVAQALKENLDRAHGESTNREELLKKQFEGERNVLTTRIKALEENAAEQAKQLAKLSQQLEKAYSQVQDVAVKAIDGSTSFKALSNLQQLVTEQSRKQPQEK